MAADYTILFDGECHVCTWSVQFIYKRDRQGRFQFASQQSQVGRHLLTKANVPPPGADSVVVLQGDQVWSESDAVLLILKHLGWFWPLLGVFRIIPRPWRNALYRWFARNRYRWFGKRKSCMVPKPPLNERFLSDDHGS